MRSSIRLRHREIEKARNTDRQRAGKSCVVWKPHFVHDEQPRSAQLGKLGFTVKSRVTEKEKPAMLQGYMKGRLKSEIGEPCGWLLW